MDRYRENDHPRGADGRWVAKPAPPSAPPPLTDGGYGHSPSPGMPYEARVMVVVSGSDGDRPWASAGVGDDRPRDAVVDALDHAPPPEGEGGVMLWWDDGAEDKYSATRGKWEKVNAAGDIVQSGRWRRVFVEQVAEIAEADASCGTGGGPSGAGLPSCDELSPHEIVAVASMVERYA